MDTPSRLKLLRIKIGLFFIFWFLAVPTLSAQNFTEEMQLNHYHPEFWTKRARNITEIERYMYRSDDFIFQEGAMPAWQNILNDEEMVAMMNTNFHPALPILNDHPEIMSFHNHSNILSEMIDELPTLMMDSYTSIPMTPELWRSLNIGSIFHEKGFLISTASLQEAHHYLEIGREIKQPYYSILTKIKGKSAKLMNFIFQDNLGKVIFAPNSHFRVAQKNFDTQNNRYLLQLDEVDTSEIGESQVISPRYNSDLLLDSPNCL